MANLPDEFERPLQQFREGTAGLRRFLPTIVIFLVVATFLATSWFKINPQEKGVILRFGKYSRTVDPGLHFKLPFGIDLVEKVPVQRQFKVEFGFRSLKPGIRTQYATQGYDEESIMLTGDLNVADVEWVTQFRITEPRDFLFKVRDVNSTFRVMNEAVMREVIGDRTINEVLTFGRLEIQFEVKKRLQELCKKYQMGVTIDQVILQDVNPPEVVKPAFNAVNQAQQERETLINKAQQIYNQIIPRARGDADRILEEAEGYAVERVNEARGDADRFNQIYAEYQNAANVTRMRMYLETMDKVLSKVERKIIVDESTAGILPLLNLSSESAQP